MIWILTLILTVEVNTEQEKKYTDEVSASEFMRVLNTETARWTNLATITDWEYESNLTSFNLDRKLKSSAKYMEWQKKIWEEMRKYPWKNFKDPLLRKQFQRFSILGTAALPDIKRSRLDEIVAEMQKIYSTTKLREWRASRSLEENPLKYIKTKSNIRLDPDLISIFSSDSDTENNTSCKLQYYWQGWHDTVGRKVKSFFEEYVKLSNEAARLNNFTDNAEFWLEDFESKDFENEVNKLYLQIRRPYQQLHAYVRRKLREHFKADERRLIKEDGLLPAHILGNVWAQQWDAIYEFSVPFQVKGLQTLTQL